MPTRGRPFEPGNTMDRGRPSGSRNKVTEEARKIFQAYVPSVMRKGILSALQGDTRLLALLMGRALGPQASSKKFGMLTMRTTDDLMRVSDLIVKKLGAGEITIAEALELSVLVERRRKLIETHELVARVQDLEEGRLRRDEPLDKAA